MHGWRDDDYVLLADPMLLPLDAQHFVQQRNWHSRAHVYDAFGHNNIGVCANRRGSSRFNERLELSSSYFGADIRAWHELVRHSQTQALLFCI